MRLLKTKAMYYEINISNANGHLFSTAKNSITTRIRLAEVFETLDKKFPETENYITTVVYYDECGTPVSKEKLRKEIADKRK